MASTLLLVIVFVFDLIAFALAVAAEQRRASARIAQNSDSRYCVYESDISTGLGVGALLFLLVSQLLVMVATRCMCCGRALSPGRSRALAVFLFITCCYSVGVLIPNVNWVLSGPTMYLIYISHDALTSGQCGPAQRVTFIIAEACLLAGSVRNAYHTKYRSVLSANPPSCETLRKGVFGAGAAFVVFTGILSEFYYVFYWKSDEGVIPTRDIGIRMGAF